MASRSGDVFVNCPFDAAFAPSFRAIVFSVLACGFRARCALEMADGAETRLDKLYRIIDESRYSVHDLSRTELDPHNNLPRFNMPLELGLFLGAKRFGENDQKKKRCLILDIQQYRYQQFISDLAGMDISAHNGDPRRIVRLVRDWLVIVSRRQSIPTNAVVLHQYDEFVQALPELALTAGVAVDDLIFPDFERLALAWLQIAE
jgi:hypothetical protein